MTRVSAATTGNEPTSPPTRTSRSLRVSGLDWEALGPRLGLMAMPHGVSGRAGRYPAGVTSRGDLTWMGLLVANREGRRWTLTRRWEPHARHPRRPDASTVKFADRRLTERYVGVAADPTWFRHALGEDATEALIAAADANRLGGCSVRLRDHLLTAHYRAPADAVPDLTETLAALRTLADALDPDAAPIPDPAVLPLCPRGGDAAVDPLTGITTAGTLLRATLPRTGGGVLGRFKAEPQMCVDWAAGTLHLPDVNVALDAIRQVALTAAPNETYLSVIDLGGAVVFVGCLPSAAPPVTWSPTSSGPPLVVSTTPPETDPPK